MRRVSVSIFGKDMIHHSFETDAESLFQAADHAIQDMCRFWWYNPEALLEVRARADRWKVSQSKVRDDLAGKRL
jgi:hypothetical protein